MPFFAGDLTDTVSALASAICPPAVRLFGMCAYNADDDNDIGAYAIVGGTCILGGAIYACVNFAKANILQKEFGSYVHAAPVFQENIKLGNGSMLSAGVDFIKGKNVGYTPGLGLRYNF